MGVLRDRASLLTVAVLLAITVAAWAALLVPALGEGAGMAMEESPMSPIDWSMSMDGPVLGLAFPALVFVAAWLVMMVAMMLPSAAPMVLLYRATATGSRSRKSIAVALFVSSYLVVWGLFGLLVYGAQQIVAIVAATSPAHTAGWPFAVAGVLALAGLYQFSALKSICLRQCRTPLSFLMTRWRPGLAGGFRLGLVHGAYCVGCCWGLMAVLVAAGAMGLAWVTVVALVVFAEKLLPRAKIAEWAVGGALLVLAAVVALRPEIASRLAV